MIDVEGEPKDFQFRQLRYMDAEELVPKIQASTQIQGVTITVGAQPAGGPDGRGDTHINRTSEPPNCGRRRRRRPELQPRANGSTTGGTGGVSTGSGWTNQSYPDDRLHQEIDLVNQLIDSLDVPSYDLRSFGNM